MNEFLLGFDAREGWLSYDSVWTKDRRREYLLREDIAKPLSTDILVWPSAFDIGGCIALSDLDPALQGFDGLELPSWVGRNHPLWSDLDQLREYVESTWTLRARPVRIIGISINLEPPIRPRGPREWEIQLDTTTPRTPQPSWRRLGYDVADNGLLSGLMSCGYSEIRHNVDSLRRKWGALLNAHHLFDSLERAFEFREFTDRRVAEHAPFYVYGLFDICAVEYSNAGR